MCKSSAENWLVNMSCFKISVTFWLRKDTFGEQLLQY